MSAGDTRSQRAAVFIYFGVIAANMMVLPTWFAPGRFPVSSRVAFIALNVLLIVFCAWKVSQLLGANPLRRRGSHPSAQLRDGYGDDLYASDPDTDELPRIDALMAEMARSQGVNEALKAANQMDWVQKMNNIRLAAEEVVLNDLIYS